MSGKNKNYNSIIFLTTLSVYLGLSLLGATPQVLAYAATTRNFDIQTEIEITDDLDNKPDREETENSVDDFPKILFDFLTEIKKEINSEKISAPLLNNFGASGYLKEYKFFQANEGSGIASGYESNDRITNLCNQFIASRVLKSGIKIAGYKDFYNEGIRIGEIKEAHAKIRADKSDLVFEISFSKSKAEIFADYLNAKYVSLGKNAQETRLKRFYENTKINAENNQVFIVTRLPRAAIDSLIK